MATKAIKFLVFLACLVIVSPFVLLVWLEKVLLKSEAVFLTFAHLLSIMPGPIGMFLRAAYYVGTLDCCAWEVHVGFGCLCTHRGARISKNVSMGAYCVIGHAAIARGVRIASRVSIPSGKRQHLDEEGRLTDMTIYEQVRIGSDAWLGEAAVVLADVGDRTIVSAGAVVIDAVPDNCIVGGNPARVLKTLGNPVTVQTEN